jgi:hypothetical protein
LFKLSLRRFWKGAEAPGEFFPRLVERAIGEPVEVVPSGSRDADLEIVEGSPRGYEVTMGRLRKMLNPRNSLDRRWSDQAIVHPRVRRSIWYTAENLRPPAAESWAGFLSFDTDPLGGRNAYLPLWLLDISDYSARGTVSLSTLINGGRPSAKRKDFLCSFIGNPEPMRFHAVERLSHLGQVDVFGASVGRPVPDRFAVARRYNFVMCFENDLYPGYITEKVLEGARTGCVPVYRGLHSEHLFNPRAFLNVAAMSSLEELASTVSLIVSNDDLRIQLLTEPVLLEPPNIEAAEALIRSVLDA